MVPVRLKSQHSTFNISVPIEPLTRRQRICVIALGVFVALTRLYAISRSMLKVNVEC